MSAWSAESFRRAKLHLPLHPLEKTLLGVLSVHLCFLPWALGDMHAWSEWISLGLGLIGMGLALAPREYHLLLSAEGKPYRLVLWTKLKRFPIFWLGMALLLYVALQGFNPSWRYSQSVQVWWLLRVRDVPWLPTGVEAPFGKFNAWRDFIIGLAAWSATCSVWVGITRRKSLRILLVVITINALALFAAGAYQRFVSDMSGFWLPSVAAGARLTATFIYHNHAGAYFALMTFVPVALATWYYYHGIRNLMKSTPVGVLAFAGLILAGAVLFTFSRGATLIMSVAVVVLLGWFLLDRNRQPAAHGGSPAVTKIMVAVFTIFVLVAARYLDFSNVYNRFDSLASQQSGEYSVHSRVLAHEAAADMLGAHALRGVGAGGFRYLFPEYLKRYPEIYQDGQLFWEHAHSDWLEVPIELGVFGDMVLLGGAGWWLWLFASRRAYRNTLAAPLLLGCGQTVVHATFDFPFHCPAIMITWCVLVAVAGRWVELDHDVSV